LDYIAVVKEQPKQAVFIDAIPDYTEQKGPQDNTDHKLFGLKSILTKSQRPGRTSKSKLPLSYSFKKAHTLYFSEEISEIETLKDSKYTVFCLQTKIYVFSQNGRQLFDIITCCNPTIYSAICKSLTG
jgi:hypothetical protein